MKAYKNLLKEKEALEASVKALTSVAPAQPIKTSEPLGVLDGSSQQPVQNENADGDGIEDESIPEGQTSVRV